MKKVLSVLLNRKNAIRIIGCVCFAAVSQPLIAWAISCLSNVFAQNDLSYLLVLRDLFVVILAIIIAWLATNIKSKLLLESELELRKQVFSGIYAMPIGDFEKKDSGSYYNQIGRDLQLLNSKVFENVIHIMTDIVSIIFIGVLLWSCHWLSVLIIVLFLIPLVINNTLMPRKIEKCQERAMQMLVGMTVKVKDVLSGFSTARFQEGEEYIRQSTFEYFEKTTVLEKGIARLSNLSALVANACVTISMLSGFIVASILMNSQLIVFSQFVLIFELGMMLNKPVVDLINSMIYIRSFQPYVSNTEKVLSVHINGDDYKLERVDTVSFENVSFSYPGKERCVLQQFNYRFERGKKYLIVGESGSGKTTLTKLLLGILHPSAGVINYNSIGQQYLSPEEIYHHSGIVPQQIYIFDDTVRRNLDLQGTCSNQQLQEIIKKVKLDKFFAANHYTLDTHISSETLQVSGGEKARIGMARVLTLNKSIVIYDEVLAGLDPQNAELIEDLILADNDQIVIHIAHNSSPKYSDRYDEVIHLNI